MGRESRAEDEMGRNSMIGGQEGGTYRREGGGGGHTRLKGFNWIFLFSGGAPFPPSPLSLPPPPELGRL